MALVAIVWLVPKAWRQPALVGTVTTGVVLSLNRIAMGGHFLSDVLLSWCITLGVIFALRPFFAGRRGAALDALLFRWAGSARTKPAQDMAVQDIGFSAGGDGPAERRAGAAPTTRRFDLVSVVVPARNEADNLAILVEEIGAALAGRAHETIVVDDGSGDHTAEVLAKLAAKGLPVRHLRHDRSCGQSRAVRTGVFSARGDVVATIDGDGQNDPSFIPVLYAALEQGGAGVGLAALFEHARRRLLDVPHQADPAHHLDDVVAQVDLPPVEALTAAVHVVVVVVVAVVVLVVIFVVLD